MVSVILFWLIVLLLMFFAFWFASGIRILKEWERAPVLRLGRYSGMKGPGIIWIIPGIDRIPMKISTRIQTYGFKSESTLSKDNVSLTVDAVLFFKAVNVEAAILQVEEYLNATQWAAQTTLREVIGQSELDEVLTHREAVAHKVQEIVDGKTEHWGIKVTSVEIRDVILPHSLVDAMARQAEAERERRARVTLAIAEAEAAHKMAEASQTYDKHPTALALRWMNLLFEASTQGNSTIILVPSEVPTAGFSASQLGVYGIRSVTEAAKEKRKEGE
jgi:regulator of protease activity HflC (stomatin/prohibitin superfamily)